MWPGPYGDGGSRKYLLASLDQSLGRTGLDHVDVFYPRLAAAPCRQTCGGASPCPGGDIVINAIVFDFDGLIVDSASNTPRRASPVSSLSSHVANPTTARTGA